MKNRRVKVGDLVSDKSDNRHKEVQVINIYKHQVSTDFGFIANEVCIIH